MPTYGQNFRIDGFRLHIAVEFAHLRLSLIKQRLHLFRRSAQGVRSLKICCNFYHIPVESNVAEKVERVGVGLLRVLRKLIEGNAALLQGFDDGARSSALLQC